VVGLQSQLPDTPCSLSRNKRDQDRGAAHQPILKLVWNISLADQDCGSQSSSSNTGSERSVLLSAERAMHHKRRRRSVCPMLMPVILCRLVTLERRRTVEDAPSALPIFQFEYRRAYVLPLA